MCRTDDHAYYLERERAALRLAERAVDNAIRNIHLAMACEYRARAARAMTVTIMPRSDIAA